MMQRVVQLLLNARSPAAWAPLQHASQTAITDVFVELVGDARCVVVGRMWSGQINAAEVHQAPCT